MVTYNNEAYGSTTYTKTEPGLGILVDNQDIYADSERYHADGSIVMRETTSEQGLRCNDRVILCNDRTRTVVGGTYFEDCGY